MQTFMPHNSYALSASVLDRLRLGKQRVEVLQLLNALHKGKGGWINHPAARMWRGHERALINYGIAVCKEWRRRGYQDTCLQKLESMRTKWPPVTALRPVWMGKRTFHASHRSNLLRKYPEHYSRFKWKEPNNLLYVWPV